MLFNSGFLINFLKKSIHEEYNVTYFFLYLLPETDRKYRNKINKI